MSKGSDGRAGIADATIRIDSLPPEGLSLQVAPDAGERDAIAAQLGFSSLERLEASLQAITFRGGIRVRGRLEAEIVQPSVVSLEPVTQRIDEPIDRVFLPGTAPPGQSSAGAEVYVDLEGEGPPDHFTGPELDLSDLIIETLALALDPYPRAEGETLAAVGELDDEAKEGSPFSVLKALKKKDEDQG